MFALTIGDGVCMAFPDVCDTPIPSPTGEIPTPLPYPNISESVACEEPSTVVMFECLPAINQLGSLAVSEGDEAGIQGGLANFITSGATVFTLGSVSVMIEGPPAQRLTSITAQNALEVLPNAVGACLVPSQETVLILV